MYLSTFCAGLFPSPQHCLLPLDLAVCLSHVMFTKRAKRSWTQFDSWAGSPSSSSLSSVASWYSDTFSPGDRGDLECSAAAPASLPGQTGRRPVVRVEVESHCPDVLLLGLFLFSSTSGRSYKKTQENGLVMNKLWRTLTPRISSIQMKS